MYRVLDCNVLPSCYVAIVVVRICHMFPHYILFNYINLLS